MSEEKKDPQKLLIEALDRNIQIMIENVRLKEEISRLNKENEELRDKIQRAIDGLASPMAHTKTQIVKILSN